MTEEVPRNTIRCYDDETTKVGRRKRRGQHHDWEESSKRVVRDPFNPAKLTQEALREAALRYLDKQDASVEQVRRVLKRRLLRHGDASLRVQVEADIEQVLARFQEARLLDDERFSRGLAESQRRRGGSLPKIRQKLRARGLSDEFIESSLKTLSEDPELDDQTSASEYARKKRLSQRFDLNDPQQRQKALSSLARQGFSFDVAKRALGL